MDSFWFGGNRFIPFIWFHLKFIPSSHAIPNSRGRLPGQIRWKCILLLVLMVEGEGVMEMPDADRE